MINEFPISTKRVLKNQGIIELNPMQQASLAAHETEKNILLLSPTGSGKTLAFLLPLLERIDFKLESPQVMIIAPTRELAIQIEDVFRSLKTGAKSVCCYGGNSMRDERKALEQNPIMVIGTPGRLDDHMKRDNIKNEFIKTLIIDEFDKSLAYGFQKEMKSIFKNLPALEWKTLTSATYAEEVPTFLKFQKKEVLDFLKGLHQKNHIEIKKVISPFTDKLQTVFDLLCYLKKGSAIIFCNHRESVERVSEFLSERGVHSGYYHGKLEQNERESTLTKFRNGSINILVATDLAARGVDIEDIDHIVHYHFPIDKETYIHRNGRTARMNADGKIFIIQSKTESLPDYISDELDEVKLENEYSLPEKPEWITLYIGAGRKDKINKVDIVGFLTKTAEISNKKIGLISLKDNYAYVAVKRSIFASLMKKIEGKKIKNKKVKIKKAD